MNVIPSSKVDVGDVSVSEESSTPAEQLKTKKKQIEYVTGKFRYDRFGTLYDLFQCYCFQIICHFQMRNKFLQGFSRLTGFNRKILVACAWLSM